MQKFLVVGLLIALQHTTSYSQEFNSKPKSATLTSNESNQYFEFDASALTLISMYQQHGVNDCYCQKKHEWVSENSYVCMQNGKSAINKTCKKGKWSADNPPTRCSAPEC